MNSVYKIGIILDNTFCDKYILSTTLKNIYSEYKDKKDITVKFNIIVNGMTEYIDYIIQQLSQYYPSENIIKVDDEWILDVLRHRHKNLIPRKYFSNDNELIYKEREKLFINGCSRILLFIPRFTYDETKLNNLIKKIDVKNKHIRKYNDDVVKEQQLLLSKGIKRRTKSLKNEKYISIFYDD